MLPDSCRLGALTKHSSNCDTLLPWCAAIQCKPKYRDAGVPAAMGLVLLSSVIDHLDHLKQDDIKILRVALLHL